MSITDYISDALRQAGIDDDVGPGSGARRGWDYWIPDTSATDGKGIARTPHVFGPLPSTWPKQALPIISPSMTPSQLLGGVWRQCLLQPGSTGSSSASDPFAVDSPFDYCSRVDQLVALIGHSPRDLALFLDDLRQRDPPLFALVLAKDFRGAAALRPTVKSAPWPAIVQRQWQGIERDYLPPFLVAVLYAELARLAVNQAGLLELSFDGGVELTTTQFLQRVPLAGSHHAPRAVTRAIEMVPYQSVALSAPDKVLKNIDRRAAKAWAKTAAGSMALAAGERNGLDLAPANPEEANFIRAAYEASPNFWLEQFTGRAASRQPRPAATRWGLNWRHHGAMGLFEIAVTAREWNARHRKGGPQLAALPRYRLAHAISTINFSWLAEFDAAAGLAQLRKIAPGKCKTWTTAMVTPLSVDGLLGGKSGDDLLREIEREIRHRPKPGAFGYTARYQAHLWLDARGDDFLHYQKLQQDALAEHDCAIDGVLPPGLQDTARIEAGFVAFLGRQLRGVPTPVQIGHNQPPPIVMTDDPAAARGAQNLGMMISPLSTNPILELLMGRK